MVQLSADGQKVMAADGYTISVWDAGSGKELFRAPKPVGVGPFTAWAMSRDGAYLAIASDDRSMVPKHLGGPNLRLNTGGNSIAWDTKTLYTGGNTIVWDMKTLKSKWKIPGVEEKTQSDRNLKGHVAGLAFAPDGARLAVMGRGLDATLRVFKLEEGQDVAQAEVTRPTKSGPIEWLPAGIALKDDTHGSPYICTQDPTTGLQKGLAIPLDLLSSFNTREREGWVQQLFTLSSDGSRAAAHISRVQKDNAEVRNNVLLIWDVVSHRQIGVFQLADDRPKPKRNATTSVSIGPFVANVLTIDLHAPAPDLQIKLSGDGKRLAVGDASGMVRVYDVDQIVAHTKSVNLPP